MNAAVIPAHALQSFPGRLLRAGLLVVTGLLAGSPLLRAQATEYTYSTIAGMAAQAGSKDGSGGGRALPQFNRPIGLAVNSSGNFYVTDASNNLVRQVTPAGAVTTFVGTAGYTGGVDGSKTDTTVTITFNSPQGPAVDSSGNLYVADYKGSTIRKITSAGVVSTLAGLAGFSGNTDGTGTAARFLEPSGLAVDSAGNVFVADSGNHTIRKITSAGVVTTFAGSAGVAGTADGTGTAARFNYPRGVAFDKSGNLLVADSTNNTIRKITTAGVVTTVAGSGGSFGSTDGAAGAARFSFPNSLAVDASGTIFVADENNHTIRLIATDGTVTTLAGLAGTNGRVDGTGNQARFDHPAGIALDADGNAYIADYGNQLIRRVTRAGVVTTIAGVGGISGTVDGSGYSLNPSLLRSPAGIAMTAAGAVYIADTGNNTIRMMTDSGTMTTLAGNSAGSGITDGTGSVARFFSPSGVAADAAGNVYVADTGNHLIRKIAPGGVVTKLAGTALTPGSADGAAATATFNYPSGIAVDGTGAVYVADNNNHTIRRIGTDGMVSTFAGTAGSVGSADGNGTAARFSFPRSLAIDSGGNLYVADAGNNRIRKITSSGTVTTLAGGGGAGSADGLGSAAKFDGPAGLTVDAAGNVYVVDTNNSTIRRVTPAGQVTTIGGAVGTEGTVDGAGSTARFNHPNAVAVSSTGNLYIADTLNHTVRLGVPPGGTAPGSGSGGSGGSGGGGSGGGGSGGADPGGGGTGTIPGEGLLLRPTGMAADAFGTYYVTDTANHCIRKILPDGTTTVFAGQSGSTGSVDGTGAAARFNNPTGITADPTGNFYVCDTGNATIRKIASDGTVTTLAGAAGTRGTADGTGSAATFNSPVGIAFNSFNTSVYVTDSVSSTIRKITSAGVVTTLAGKANTIGDKDGVGADARFNNPEGITIDAAYALFVTDTFNHTVRRVATLRQVRATALGTVTTAGTMKVTLTDPGLTGSPVVFNVAVAVDDTPSTWGSKVVTALTGNAAVVARYTPVSNVTSLLLTYLTSDDGQIANLAIEKGTAVGIEDALTSTATSVSGTVTTLAGSAGISGAYDGTGLFALFNLPRGIALDGNGVLYVADTGNSSIRRVTPRGVVNTMAGIGGISGFRDGAATSALFNQPQGIFAYSSIWVVDTGNSVLRSVAPTGTTVTSLPLKAATTTPSTGGGGSSGGGGGGGGAPSLWFVSLLGLLGAARLARASRSK